MGLFHGRSILNSSQETEDRCDKLMEREDAFATRHAAPDRISIVAARSRHSGCVSSCWFGLFCLGSLHFALFSKCPGVFEKVPSCFVRQYLVFSKCLESVEEAGLPSFK